MRLYKKLCQKNDFEENGAKHSAYSKRDKRLFWWLCYKASTGWSFGNEKVRTEALHPSGKNRK